MSVRSTNSGFCALCGKRATKTKMMAHVEACAAAHDEIGQPQPLVVLRFGPVGAPRWLESRPRRTRNWITWMPCCANCGWNAVDIGARFRHGRRELAMTTPMAAAFAGTASKVEYEYDFGSTTALTGELVGKRQGSIGRTSVRLLARNEPLVWPCRECEAPATVVCPSASIPLRGSSAMHIPMCTNTPSGDLPSGGIRPDAFVTPG